MRLWGSAPLSSVHPSLCGGAHRGTQMRGGFGQFLVSQFSDAFKLFMYLGCESLTSPDYDNTEDNPRLASCCPAMI